MRPEIVFFDVNETLLDLAGLQPRFVELFGTADPLGEWFVRMLHGSLVANHTHRYRPLDLIGAEALTVLGQKRGVEVSVDQAAALVEAMTELAPHPEVPAALDELRAEGFRLAALTNNSNDVLTAQLANAGIADRFERAISVEAVGRFKPAPEVYLHAAAIAGVEVDRGLMVASHDWDLLGARSVGMPGAFVARPGAVWGLPDGPPEIVGPDLAVVARLLVGLTGG